MGTTMTTSRKPPKPGKGSQFQARITDDMRKSIEAEADRTGRSLSQVAELWLEFGRAEWAKRTREIAEAKVIADQQAKDIAAVRAMYDTQRNQLLEARERLYADVGQGWFSNDY